MKKMLTRENLIRTVLVMYVLSIVLDLHFFYNSISTLIRIGVISVLFLIIFIKYSNQKEKKIFIYYFLFLSVYILFHLINSGNFNIKIDTSFSYLEELLYLYKMIMNIFILYIVYKLEIDLKLVTRTIKILLWLISGSIVISNLLKIGYSTYSFEPITANILSWFNLNGNTFEEISGKGYFHLANQIIAVIILYYPILINDIKEKVSFSNILLSFIVLFSMLILGNRISTLGPLIILVFSFILYLLLVYLKKENFNFKFFSFLLVSIIVYNVFLFNSPLLQRENYYEEIINNSDKKQDNTNIENNTEKEIEIVDRFNDKLINLNFPLKYYKYENDPEFWEEMLTKNPGVLSDSRYLEISIIDRVKGLNNNVLDDYFGIGYNRIINIFNIERDYVMQYYSVGIIGAILLLGAYFIIYIYSGFKILFNLENKFNFKILSLGIGTGFFLVAAYFSGNLLNAISTIIPLSFILGVLLNEVNKKESGNNKILGFKIPSLNNDELIEKIRNDIKINKQVIVYNVNPLIMMNFYENNKMKKEFNLSDYNIPDGIGTIYASKMKDGSLKERIAGIEFFDNLCSLGEKENLKIFLYGSKDNIAEQAKQKILEKYPKIQIAGTLNGFVSEKDAIKKIRESKPDMLFIALGSPKQENFIVKNKKEFSKIKIIMPVGGTFDVVSGNIKRAPNIIIKFHLEWLYRMIKEPRRILVNLNIIKYLFLVIFRNNCYNETVRVRIKNDKKNDS